MRKLIFAISALALATIGGVRRSDRRPQGADEGERQGKSACSCKMAKGESRFRRRGGARRRLTTLNDNAQKIDVAASVPGREATRATRPLPRKSGKTWPGSRPRWTSSRRLRPQPAAAPAQDVEALKPQLGAIGAELRRAATRRSASRRADRWACWRKLIGRRAGAWRHRRGGVLVFDRAEAARCRRRSQRSARATRRAASASSGRAAARPATRARSPKAMRGSNSPAGCELKTPFGTFVPPNISSDPQRRHRQLVARGFRQRHDARRVAGRQSSTTRPFPMRPMRG